MSNHEHHEHIEDHDPSVHHEESDVNVRAILVFAAWFIGGFVLCVFALLFLFNAFKNYEARKDAAPLSEAAGAELRQYPPAPRLQPFPEPGQVGLIGTDKAKIASEATELSAAPVADPHLGTPVADMVELRKQYDNELTTYGWVDRTQGVVRIPIEEAKKRLLAQGLPARGAATLTPVAPTTVPADANVPSPQPQTQLSQPAQAQVQQQ